MNELSRMEQVALLHLKRPLVFFDLETTGTKVGVDRIVEMAMVKLMPDGTVIKKPENLARSTAFSSTQKCPFPWSPAWSMGCTTKMCRMHPRLVGLRPDF